MTTLVVNDSDDGDFCGDGYSGGGTDMAVS